MLSRGCFAIAVSAILHRHEKTRYSMNSGFFFFGAGEMNRTPDLLITNELLYRLSYTGVRDKL